ncbi:unnamed protein product [Dicrocoelium dendriticum]|nr:unnamed protein product [Dicrocoelium dendriticum]
MSSATIEVVNSRDGASHLLEFVIVEDELTLILCINSIQSLGLVVFNHGRLVQVRQRETDISDQYPSVFSLSLEKFERTAHLLDPLIQPTALPARRVPFALRDRFSAELSKLVREGVIAIVDGLTE